MVKLIKYVLGFVALAVLGFLYVVNYDLEEVVRTRCGGVALTINKYPWFAHLWSNSDGNGYLTRSDGQTIYISDIAFNFSGNATVIILKSLDGHEGRYVVAHKSLTWKGTQYECS